MTSDTAKQIHVPKDEILLSRTDERGIILAANAAFVETSGYALDELLRAPQKIVRHPDMPKGVFYRLWDDLNKGHTTGGFIKNQTKNGDFYWVFALIAPVQGGFLSQRTAPSSDTVHEMSKLYAALIAEESDSKMKPAESAAALEDAVIALGHKSYEAFIAHSLEASRASWASDSQTALRTCIQTMQSAWSDVKNVCENLVSGYEAFRIAPVNMRIQAGHMGDDGIALDVIAANFAGLAQEVNRDLTKYTASISSVEERLDNCLYLDTFQALSEKSIQVLTNEDLMSDEDIGFFHAQASGALSQVSSSLAEVKQELARFADRSERIKRNLSGLSMTKVMCAIENTKTPKNQASSVGAIIAELGLFQENTERRLRTISEKLHAVNNAVRAISNLQKTDLAKAS